MATQTQPDGTDAGWVALALAYQAQTVNLRLRLENHVRRFWRSLGSYRNADMTRYMDEMTPVIAGAQTQMAALTSQFIAQQRQQALGGALRVIAVDSAKVVGAAARNGADPTVVHGRPFHLVWRQLDELPHVPGSISQAFRAGEDRAVELALDDTQLTKTRVNAETSRRDDRVKYVERVLEGAYSCGLCIVASTQRYHPGVLQPIHGGCDCSQAFRYTDTDPGQILHLDRLQNIHDVIEQRFGDSSPGARKIPGTASNYDKALQYRDALVSHEHGELGEVLAVRGQPFTGPADIAA